VIYVTPARKTSKGLRCLLTVAKEEDITALHSFAMIIEAAPWQFKADKGLPRYILTVSQLHAAIGAGAESVPLAQIYTLCMPRPELPPESAPSAAPKTPRAPRPPKVPNDTPPTGKAPKSPPKKPQSNAKSNTPDKKPRTKKPTT
jgi:hypothetical protein